MRNPSQSYVASPLTPARQTSTRFTYPRRTEGWVILVLVVFNNRR